MSHPITSFSHLSLFKEKGEYSIHYNSCCPILIRSIAYALSNNNCSIYKNQKITFTAKKVQPLELFLLEKQKKFDYNLCLSLLYNLEIQNNFLKKEDSCIFGISLNDIFVVDDKEFIFTNPKKIKSADSSGTISFLSPFDRSGFCSPEILKITALPSSINVNTFYYSLGALLIFCISNVHIQTHESADFLFFLKPIYGTKLYWMILRLLCGEPEKRCFLYV